MTREELIIQIKNNVNKKLASVLAQYKGRHFTIMLNNEIMTFNSPTGDKIIRAAYKGDDKPGQFHLGYFESVNGKPEFRNNLNFINVIIKELLQTEIFGIDFTDGVNPNSYSINIDNGFNVIYIESSIYSFSKAVTLRVEKPFRLQNQQFINEEQLFSLKEKFTQHSIDMYIQVCSSIVLKRLKSANTLKFYKLYGIYIPTVISGSFIFNPFIEIPSLKSRFQESDLYKLADKNKKSFGNMAISYLTQRELCETMHLQKFVGMNWKMFTSMLAGNFLLTYPNSSTSAYILRNVADLELGLDPIVTDVIYNNLNESIKERYIERDTLYILALQNASLVGTRDIQALYNIIKDNYI